MSNTTLFVAWFLAIKTLLKNKKVLIIISLVLTISFVSLLFFGSIIDGLTYKFEEQIITGSAGHILIETNDDEKYITSADNLFQKVIKLPLTKAASKRIKVAGSLETNEVSITKTITGITPSDESKVTVLATSIIEGRYLSDGDKNEILLGSSLVRAYATKASSTKLLDVKTGDNIEVYFNNGVHESFTVKGIYQTGWNSNDQEAFITNKKMLDIYPNLEDTASEISIRLPGRGYETEYKTQLISTLSIRDKISDWTQKTSMIEQLTGSLTLVNKIMYFTGILTAIATVYIIIYIDVTHKRKQIGILKAVGIRKNAILLSFVIQACIYGFIGVFLGLVMIFALEQLFIAYPLNMPIGKTNMILNTSKLMESSVILIVASMFAGLIPAYQAAKSNILEAIFGG